MSKTKLRCNTCGKWFQSANAKEQTCPDCMQKARKEKQAAKNAPPTAKQAGPGSGPGAAGTNFQARPAPPPKPKPAPSEGNPRRWFDNINDIKVGQPDEPTRPKIPSYPAPRPDRGTPEREGPREPGSSGNYREGSREQGGYGNYRDREGPNREQGNHGNYRDREGQNRGQGGQGSYRGSGNYREGDRDRRGSGVYHVSGSIGAPGTLSPRPRQPMEGGYPRGPRPGSGGERPGPGGEKPFRPKKPKSSAPKAPPQPRPKKEKKAPPAPFVPNEEQIKQVETRYLELAVPTEYDGIRTQISKELEIPKKAVKQIIKDLRNREEIPSWWDIQTYKGPNEELEKIKEVYLPMLPLPPVGVHKQIAEQLSLKPVDVYQAIKKIRLDMNLPQYNDPALHGIELKPRRKKEAEAPTQEGEQAAEVSTAAAEAEESIQPATAETQAAVDAPATVEALAVVEAPSATEEPGTPANAEEATAPKDEAETVVTQAEVTENAAADTTSEAAVPATEPTAQEDKPSEAVAATTTESGTPE
ncbi:MAG TPA: hypothetical protein VFQ30_09575 [Ktedonobacteraceae bacterium]|nr:hypothetical protein [Ktedonobacteraceae bacterium]